MPEGAHQRHLNDNTPPTFRTGTVLLPHPQPYLFLLVVLPLSFLSHSSTSALDLTSSISSSSLNHHHLRLPYSSSSTHLLHTQYPPPNTCSGTKRVTMLCSTPIQHNESPLSGENIKGSYSAQLQCDSCFCNFRGLCLLDKSFGGGDLLPRNKKKENV